MNAEKILKYFTIELMDQKIYLWNSINFVHKKDLKSWFLWKAQSLKK